MSGFRVPRSTACRAVLTRCLAPVHAQRLARAGAQVSWPRAGPVHRTARCWFGVTAMRFRISMAAWLPPLTFRHLLWREQTQDQKLSASPAALPSYFSLSRQRKVAKRKPARRPRGSCAAVPCVARNPAAGANSRIPALKHARLSPPDSCATRRYHGTEDQKLLLAPARQRRRRCRKLLLLPLSCPKDKERPQPSPTIRRGGRFPLSRVGERASRCPAAHDAH